MKSHKMDNMELSTQAVVYSEDKIRKETYDMASLGHSLDLWVSLVLFIESCRKCPSVNYCNVGTSLPCVKMIVYGKGLMELTWVSLISKYLVIDQSERTKKFKGDIAKFKRKGNSVI